MNTSEKSRAKIRGLIDPRRAERFLLDLANHDPLNSPLNELLASVVRETSVRASGAMNRRIVKAAERIKRLYPEMAQPFGEDFDMWVEVLYWTQIFLRRSWAASDDRHRNWYLYEMRRQYRDAVVQARERARMKAWGGEPNLPYPRHGDLYGAPEAGGTLMGTDRRLIDPPEMTPFEAVTSYFQSRVGQRAKYCAYEGCCAPYFIAPPAKARKYCSVKCSNDADAINKHESYLRKKAEKEMSQ